MKAALRVAGSIFSLVALAHLLRVIYKVPLIVGNYPVRLRVSVVSFIVSTLVAYWMFKAASCGEKKGCCGS
ncbi:MAG: hypothetical protein ACM3OC_04735 [Deltaproteobacteria bacterium]